VASLVLAASTSFTVVAVAALIFVLAIGLDLGKPGGFPLLAAMNTLLGNAVTKFMADVSYGVYLVHGFFISIFGGWLYRQPFAAHWSARHHLAWIFLVTLFGAYALSFLLHLCVEKPGIKLGRRTLAGFNAKPKNPGLNPPNSSRS
jgi:peptidoglycan/LPS O-acetylase OafA/YrhL